VFENKVIYAVTGKVMILICGLLRHVT